MKKQYLFLILIYLQLVLTLMTWQLPFSQSLLTELE